MHRFKLGFLFLMFLFIVFGLVGCEDKPFEVVIEHTTETIMTDTIYETEVHYFATNVEGPRVVIVGGIHGDEIAGWQVAHELLDYEFYFGSFMIIPYASVLAIQLVSRYPGNTTGGIYEQVTYSDLNRIFPGSVSGSVTAQLAYAIIQKVIDFDPDYAVDLHESRKSYLEGYLGDSIIYSNPKAALMAIEMVEEMNTNHLESGDVAFRADNSAPVGSFNYYCSQELDIKTFTFETNRLLPITKRKSQQMALFEIFLSKIK